MAESPEDSRGRGCGMPPPVGPKPSSLGRGRGVKAMEQSSRFEQDDSNIDPALSGGNASGVGGFFSQKQSGGDSYGGIPTHGGAVSSFCLINHFNTRRTNNLDSHPTAATRILDVLPMFPLLRQAPSTLLHSISSSTKSSVLHYVRLLKRANTFLASARRRVTCVSSSLVTRRWTLCLRGSTVPSAGTTF
jgi:hypothetical protein